MIKRRDVSKCLESKSTEEAATFIDGGSFEIDDELVSTRLGQHNRGTHEIVAVDILGNTVPNTYDLSALQSVQQSILYRN